MSENRTHYRADSIGQRHGMRTIYEITPSGKQAAVVVPESVVIDVVEALNRAAHQQYTCKCCTDNECECGGHKTGPVTRTGEIEVQS